MPVLRCVICKRPKPLYKLNKCYGPNDRYPIRTYLIELLGIRVERLLRDDDGICNLCVCLLNKLLFITRWVYIFIGYNGDGTRVSFAPVFKNFLANLPRLAYEECVIGVQHHAIPLESGNQAKQNVNHEDPTNSYPIRSEDYRVESIEAHHATVNANRGVGDDTAHMNREEDFQSELLQVPHIRSSLDLQKSPYGDRAKLSQRHTKHRENSNALERNTNHDRGDGRICTNTREEYEREFLQAHHTALADNEYDAELNESYEYGVGTSRLHRREGEYGSEVGDEFENELLAFSHTSPYDEVKERKLAKQGYPNRGRRRGRTRTRRRGHNWTRRKGSRSKSRLSTYTDIFPKRNRGQSSRMSLNTYLHSDRSEDGGDDDDYYDHASIAAYSDSYESGMYHNKRARSVGSQPDDEVIYRYKCLGDCPEQFRNLTELTDHKIKEHHMLAKFICYECYATKFVSPEDLKRHNDIHHRILISNCPLCSVELPTVDDLQNHIAQHKLFSYPCTYCDRSFLSKNSRNKHIGEYHKGKKKRLKRLATIVNCVYKSNTSQLAPSPHNDYEGQILWRLQRSHVRRLRDLCIDTITRLYKGGVDITNLMTITYGEKTIDAINNLEASNPANEISPVLDEDDYDVIRNVTQDVELETMETLTAVDVSDDVCNSEETAPSLDNSVSTTLIPRLTNGPEKIFDRDRFENFVKRTTPRLVSNSTVPRVKKSNNKSKYLQSIESKHKELKVKNSFSNYDVGKS